MAHKPARQVPGGGWVVATVLAGLIVTAGVIGAIVTASQRQPTPRPTNTALSPAPFPTITPTPVPSGPVVGIGFSVADDVATRQVVVFGGIDSYATTWLWSGSRWSLARPRLSPAGRFSAAAAYDPATRQVMLFGGRLSPGEVVNDTWAWVGTTWQELDSGAGGPPPGEGALMAWDDAMSEMVLVTPGESAPCETWVWVGGRWTRQQNGDLRGSADGMSFDAVTHSLLLIGTQTVSGAATATWQWSGNSWRELPTSIAASPASLALDPASGHLLLYGTTPRAPLAQLWSWGGAAWTPLPHSELPIQPGAEIGDVEHDQFLAFGWRTQPNQGSPQPLEVWRWIDHGWQQVTGAST